MTAESARTFPAFAPRRARGIGAVTWWGRAWTDVLEGAALAHEPLRRGRTYANSGLVGAITVGPGRIVASVADTDGARYRTELRVEPFDDAGWARLLDEVGARAGHLAALLDRDLPRDLVAAAADAELPLLPEIGELDTECGCPGWELPCRHAAALGYQAAWLLDADPFVLFLLRGRDERDFLDRLRERSARAGAVGVAARDAYRPADTLPADPPPVREPAVLLRVAPAPGIPAGVLESLAAEAAHRARALLAELDAAPDHAGSDGPIQGPPAGRISR
ncbi:SWIM zinc finger family protein [Embleya sp. AB8]|uniref:SWIM zinc finger family protein n=1 Tax=Embleya sp. AB8 TaxID=3156304 RepID=UPI003C750F72